MCILAHSSADHKLKWDMFKLSDLECFDSMMFRMFKQEMEALITRHETYRYVIFLLCSIPCVIDELINAALEN